MSLLLLTFKVKRSNEGGHLHRLSIASIYFVYLGRGLENSQQKGRSLNTTRVLSDKHHTGPKCGLDCSQREIADLYLSLLNPIRGSHSITPCIQGIKTAISELHSLLSTCCLANPSIYFLPMLLTSPVILIYFITLLNITPFLQICPVCLVFKYINMDMVSLQNCIPISSQRWLLKSLISNIFLFIKVYIACSSVNILCSFVVDNIQK